MSKAKTKPKDQPVKKRTLEQMRKQFWEVLTKLAEEAHRRYCQNINQRLYLAGMMTDGIWTSFDIIGDNPSSLRAVLPDPLPRSLTPPGLAQWMFDRLKSEPNWCYAD